MSQHTQASQIHANPARGSHQAPLPWWQATRTHKAARGTTHERSCHAQRQHRIPTKDRIQGGVHRRPAERTSLYECSRLLSWPAWRTGRSARGVHGPPGMHLRQLPPAHLLHVHGPRERHRRRFCPNPEAHDPGVRMCRRMDRHSAVRQLRAPYRQPHHRRRGGIRPRRHLLWHPRTKADRGNFPRHDLQPTYQNAQVRLPAGISNHRVEPGRVPPEARYQAPWMQNRRIWPRRAGSG